MWFRRDLRLKDNPALIAAIQHGPVLPLFVLDPALLHNSGASRRSVLYRTLRSLNDQLSRCGARLTVCSGDPVSEIARLAAEIGAGSVHIAADFGPYGAVRDLAVERALADDGIPLIRTGSPYAIAPGRIRNESGDAYRVFTAFYRAWRRHGWRGPAPSPNPEAAWITYDGLPTPEDPVEKLDSATELTEVGEEAALRAWDRFRRAGLDSYSERRNHPAADGTSHLSVHLKFGTVHPRTLLADLGPADEAFSRQLAWREFYAAVLHFWPASARQSLRPVMLDLPRTTERLAEQHFAAWREGRTGYPFVDAGMRQLLATGWMHNRLRMVTASFLVKDLHLDWTWGARHFMEHLIDGDLANNQHGWQWVAGTGTDAAPYHRILNPVTQSRRFDPDGTYIRRWVPELADLSSMDVHTPWELESGPPNGYPDPVVDHASERRATLAALGSARG
jgi:deoxyribodipyrimidine photo-lyase